MIQGYPDPERHSGHTLQVAPPRRRDPPPNLKKGNKRCQLQFKIEIFMFMFYLI